MSVHGTFRTCRSSRCMSVIGATADVICSKRVFRLLTPNGRCDYWFDHARRIKVFLLLTAWRMALRARATPGGYQDCKRRRRARRKDGLRLLVRQQSLVQSIASQSFDVLVSERTGRPSPPT